MAKIEQLSVALPEPIANAVRRAIESGEYASANEVIRDALALWEARRQHHDGDIEVLRSAWDAGKSSGLAGSLDIKRLIAEERAKLEAFVSGRD